MQRRSFLVSVGSALLAAAATPAFGQDPTPRMFSADDFINSVGLDIHLGRKQTLYINVDAVIALLKELGVTHVRDDAIFAGYFTRDHDFYKHIRTVVAAGCRFSLVCADPVNGFLFVPPRRVQDIYDWSDQGVEIFEGANESDLFRKSTMNPAISAEHQRALYAAIKGNPKLRNIIVASPSYIQKSVPLAEDISDVIDWLNIHPYPGMEHPETKGPGALAGFIAASQRFGGNKPILVSETGYHTALQTTTGHLPVSEAIKTRYLPRLLLFNFISGVKRTYIYELIDSNNNGPADKESNFGLVSFDGTPKSSFAAVKQLLALFNRPARPGVPAAKMQYSINGGGQDVWTAAFARDDGTHVVFVWLGVSGWDQGPRALRPPVTRSLTLAVSPASRSAIAHQFQDDGSIVRRPLDKSAGGFAVTASDQLTAVEIGV
ncbi:hypothetical protein ACVWZ4_000741 [Bradyrhizobium sp. USDA 4472]